MALIASGVICNVHSDPDYPEFVSIANSALNILTPNPDFMYYWARISSGGIYRIGGFRNTSRFVELGFLSGLYAMPHNKGTVGALDLDTLNIRPDGSFELIVSRERPAGYDGDWFQMPAEADNLLVRSACFDWLAERDPLLSGWTRLRPGPGSPPKPSPNALRASPGGSSAPARGTTGA